MRAVYTLTVILVDNPVSIDCQRIEPSIWGFSESLKPCGSAGFESFPFQRFGQIILLLAHQDSKTRHVAPMVIEFDQVVACGNRFDFPFRKASRFRSIPNIRVKYIRSPSINTISFECDTTQYKHLDASGWSQVARIAIKSDRRLKMENGQIMNIRKASSFQKIPNSVALIFWNRTEKGLA